MAGHCAGRGGYSGAAYDEDVIGRPHGHGRGRDNGRAAWRWGRERAEVAGTLLGLKRGDEGIVGHISDDRARAQAVRFGIGSGALVNCISTLPGGPVVVRAGRQEIAIGRGLAAHIEVRPASVGYAS